MVQSLPSNSIVIRSTSPNHEWIRAFVKDIVRNGGNAEKINFYARFREDFSYNDATADQTMAEKERQATHIIQPFLHPRYHKNYLVSVSQLYQQLAENRRVLLVHDVPDLPQENGDESRLEVVDQLAVDGVLKNLRLSGFETRIMDRNAAITYLTGIVALR